MEASPSRSDSFSRGGWPRRSSFERLDDVVDAAALVGESFSSSTASFIEMDPEELFSMRWTSEEDGFHFGLPRAGAAAACSPLLASAGGLVIFSDDDSLLLPCCEGGTRDDDVIGRASSACSSPAFHTAHSTPASVVSSSRRSSSPGGGGGTKKAPLRILLRYLRFLVPLCRKARALRLPVPVPGRVFSAAPRHCSRAVAATPARRSTSSSASSGAAEYYWCHGNADVDVRDAILHCKKSLLTARTEC